MSLELDDFIAAGKQLTVDERLEAAHQLLLSIQHDDASAGPEWEAELLHRAEDALAGTAVLHDVDESHPLIRAELAAMRRR